MKNIYIILLVLISANCSYGQFNPETKLVLISQNQGNVVNLRWIPKDENIWKEGVASGYLVERYTTHISGVEQSFGEIANSKIEIVNNYKPLSEAQWNANFTDNNFAIVGKGSLYTEDETVVISDSPSLADAINQSESKETRFLFGLYAAEQDFNVAKGMALGIEDANVEVGNMYMYRVVLLSDDENFQGINATMIMDMNEIVSLPSVSNLSGKGEDKAIFLTWKIKDVSQHYSTYNIERSIDNVNFEKANEVPFVFAAEGVEEPEYVTFKDKVDDNGIAYYYRVKGNTPFGNSGPPSASVLLKGAEPRINIFINFNDSDLTDDVVTLNWEGIDPAIINSVAGIKIYRSTNAQSDFELLTTTLLSNNTTTFVDNNPLNGAAYYVLECVDVNDYTYRSPSLLIQPNDTDPPAIPEGLTGTFVTSKRLAITWDSNTEEDLKGYKVFIGNSETSTFTEVTSVVIKEPEYEHIIDPQFMLDEIYVKVLAVDLRDNYSELSQPFGLDRPDVVPPSKPVLYKVVPTPEGIQLGFEFSTSDDRVNHTLQYKPNDSPNWMNALEIGLEEEPDYIENITPNDITATNYVIPNDLFQRRPYDFRMTVVDADDNISGTDVKTITPYDNGLRGIIHDFQIALGTVPSNGSQINVLILIEEIILKIQEQGYLDQAILVDLYQAGVISLNEYNELVNTDLESCIMFLKLRHEELNQSQSLPGLALDPQLAISWTYHSAETPADFQIFRSAEGSSMALYKTITLDGTEDSDPYLFEDEDLKKGKRYFYQVMARHAGGGFSERSDVLMILVD